MMSSICLSALTCGELGIFNGISNDRCLDTAIIIPALFTLVLAYA